MRITKAAFRAAVEEAADRQRLASPVVLRTLRIDFAARTVQIDRGQPYELNPATDVFVIPIINTERVLLP